MAKGFNKAIIMGNLARDPEIRYTATKQAVGKLTVAVGHQYKAKDGTKVDQVDFIPVSVWGASAENCERYLRKGRPVLVEGRIQVRSYEKDGEKKYATEVVAQNVLFLGGGKDEGKKDGFGERATEEEFPMDIPEGPDNPDIPF